jgi:hypothetical protein
LGFTFIILNFSALKLDKILVANLEKQKLSSLTPIQEIAIPAILEGRDCLAIAPTGTEKRRLSPSLLFSAYEPRLPQTTYRSLYSFLHGNSVYRPNSAYQALSMEWIDYR